MTQKNRIRKRNQIPVEDTWNLSRIYASEGKWESHFKKVRRQIGQYADHIKTMSDSAARLADCLTFDMEMDKSLEKLGSYAYLKMSEDINNSTFQAMVGRYTALATQAQEAASFINPAIQAISAKKMRTYLKSPRLKLFRFQLEQLLRFKHHTLSRKEERLLSMQGEVAGAAGRIFRQLSDADLRFGSVRDEKGNMVELTQSSWGSFLESPSRPTRKKAFEKMFGVHEAFAGTLATTYSTSVLQDVYQSKVRNFSSSIESALFADNVPLTVYDNLIASVRNSIHINHRYLKLHKKMLGLKKLHFYDTYLPLVKNAKWKSSYAASVDTILEAVSPLGANYARTLGKGLTQERWVDKYENRGKRSGAFSAGGYRVLPYILMNYDANSVRGIYTLAHEAGHSMHTWLSARHQPFPDYEYTIFVAEVASTFNEQLLTHHMLRTARSKKLKAYIIDREINQIRATLIRQTMFAEFEKITHAIAEHGEPLTIDRLREEYGKLVSFYFGPALTIDPLLTMEWARIPHFYSAFYVYKYATGIAAALALSQRVLEGGKSERDDYLNFLQSGGSQYPLDLLRGAGVNLESPEPVANIMQRLDDLINQLEGYLTD